MVYVKLSHIIFNVEPHKCIDEVDIFCKEKKDAVKTYSTTAIPVNNGGQQAIAVVTSCLIIWEVLESQREEYYRNIRIKNGQIKIK